MLCDLNHSGVKKIDLWIGFQLEIQLRKKRSKCFHFELLLELLNYYKIKNKKYEQVKKTCVLCYE